MDKDKFYRKAKYGSDAYIYWGTKKDILVKLLELQIILKEKKLNWETIKINSGHRTPRTNIEIGGASKSRHIAGEAIDMKIGDIDNNGFYSDKDKQLILEICEKELIKNKGGIGKYPGTRVVHIDTRGYKARWDDY